MVPETIEPEPSSTISTADSSNVKLNVSGNTLNRYGDGWKASPSSSTSSASGWLSGRVLDIVNASLDGQSTFIAARGTHARTHTLTRTHSTGTVTAAAGYEDTSATEAGHRCQRILLRTHERSDTHVHSTLEPTGTADTKIDGPRLGTVT